MTDLEIRQEVEAALELIRPAIRMDGGNCELVDIEDGIVKVEFSGACGGCPMSLMTLKLGVERAIKSRVPSIKSVEAI